MNRRKFLEWLGLATAGVVVAPVLPEVVYSFPSVIVPQNIMPVSLPTAALGNAGDVNNWIDFYAKQLIMANDYFNVNPPLWSHLENVNQRGVRFYFNKSN
jgi:hypothetical protein